MQLVTEAARGARRRAAGVDSAAKRRPSFAEGFLWPLPSRVLFTVGSDST